MLKLNPDEILEKLSFALPLGMGRAQANALSSQSTFTLAFSSIMEGKYSLISKRYDCFRPYQPSYQ
jgi:hypothetical protein